MSELGEKGDVFQGRSEESGAFKDEAGAQQCVFSDLGLAAQKGTQREKHKLASAIGARLIRRRQECFDITVQNGIWDFND